MSEDIDNEIDKTWKKLVDVCENIFNKQVKILNYRERFYTDFMVLNYKISFKIDQCHIDKTPMYYMAIQNKKYFGLFEQDKNYFTNYCYLREPEFFLNYYHIIFSTINLILAKEKIKKAWELSKFQALISKFGS